MRATFIRSLFTPEPEESFGTRGNLYLWEEAGQYLGKVQMPSSESQLRNLLIQTFENLTGHELAGDADEELIVARYADRHGMSRDIVVRFFWLKKVIPLVLARYRANCRSNGE